MADKGKALKVLAVDDDIALRGIIVNNIRKAGFEVESAGDGQEGLETARGFEPDIIVSDIMMPKMDGVEMLRRVRQSEGLRETYVIMLTAKDKTADLLEGFEATADDYVTKPFKVAELVARVKAGARLKTMQNDLSASNRRLREMVERWARLIGVAAHDLRNPINIVTTYISLLGQDIVSADEIKEVCLRRSTDMVGLIDNLLDITKIEAGMIDLEAVEVDCGLLLGEAASLFEPVARQKQVMLECARPDGLTAFCDRSRLLEMMNTLFHEAIRLSPKNRKVKAVLEQVGAEIAFSISTDGGGFGEDDATHIFKPPIHSHAIPEGYDASSLLGFAIVRKLALLMGGEVFACSKGDKEGASFGFRLPRPEGDGVEAAALRFKTAADSFVAIEE